MSLPLRGKHILRPCYLLVVAVVCFPLGVLSSVADIAVMTCSVTAAAAPPAGRQAHMEEGKPRNQGSVRNGREMLISL